MSIFDLSARDQRLLACDYVEHAIDLAHPENQAAMTEVLRVSRAVEIEA